MRRSGQVVRLPVVANDGPAPAELLLNGRQLVAACVFTVIDDELERLDHLVGEST
ncbi:MAG: hypothetical protein M3O70_26700 [Actinomycetota bacterium]|nr:hypothetical protein [Actinomycetota bacterium]